MKAHGARNLAQGRMIPSCWDEGHTARLPVSSCPANFPCTMMLFLYKESSCFTSGENTSQVSPTHFQMIQVTCGEMQSIWLTHLLFYGYNGGQPRTSRGMDMWKTTYVMQHDTEKDIILHTKFKKEVTMSEFPLPPNSGLYFSSPPMAHKFTTCSLAAVKYCPISSRWLLTGQLWCLKSRQNLSQDKSKNKPVLEKWSDFLRSDRQEEWAQWCLVIDPQGAWPLDRD